MDENLKIKVGLDSLQKANSYSSSKNYGRAFAHYLVYLELLPNERNQVETEFSETLHNWGIALEQKTQIENLCKCYLQALKYFPLNSEILNNFGVHLIRINQNEEAEKYLKLANNLDKDYLLAEKNLLTVKMNLVPRWHFRMLNDYDRNDIYRQAIFSYSEEENVKALDIGTGSGILSLFAANHAAIEHIYAIEASTTMAKIARDVFKANAVAKVTVINKNSLNITTDCIGGHADLLIMEIFDAALFGEHVLSTVIHAWESLLKQSARIIPAGADIFVTGVQCVDLARAHKFYGKVTKLSLHNICLSQSTAEPYEAENLKNFHVQKITNTKSICYVSFNDIEQLKGIYHNKNFMNPIILDCNESGIVDTLVIWFDLHLVNNITITTNPQNENVRCWEQAVIYLDHPFEMKLGDTMKVSCSFVNSKLETSVLCNPPPCSQCFKSSPGVVSLLNDDILVHALEKLSDTFSNPVHILDLYNFPLLGLIVAKKGGKCYCSLQSAEDEMFVKYVCDRNSIDLERVVNLKENVETFLRHENLLDVILLDPVSKNGTLSEACLNDWELYFHCLKVDGVILPKLANLHVQVIDSRYLDYFNKVDDRNLFGYEIAKFINEYAVLEQWVVDLNFSHEKLSEPVLVSNVLQNDRNPCWTERDVPITMDGKPNGILYWFELVYDHHVKIDTYASTFYKCACFLLEQPDLIQNQTIFHIKVKQHCGLLKIFCNR